MFPRSVARHQVFRVAVSGGSLPATLAKALLAEPVNDQDKFSFNQWEIYFADERAVYFCPFFCHDIAALKLTLVGRLTTRTRTTDS